MAFANLASARANGISWPFSKLSHASQLIFLERLLNLRAVIHDKRAVAYDRFVDRLAVHH